MDCFVSAPDASFARREAFLRSVTRVLAKGGVYVCMPVCGVDVVTLLNYGVACRAAPGVSGVAPLAGDDWEARRSGNGACTFEVLQIVASQQKHLFRCAPNAGGDVALLGALLDAGSLESSPTLPATGDAEAGTVDADDDADFDDAPCASLTLRRGFFCGSCGGTVAPLKFPLEVPEACPNCLADVRRFAMSQVILTYPAVFRTRLARTPRVDASEVSPSKRPNSTWSMRAATAAHVATCAASGSRRRDHPISAPS